jgi:hypothetical protein
MVVVTIQSASEESAPREFNLQGGARITLSREASAEWRYAVG